MQCNVFKELVKEAEAIANDVEAALEDADPETITALAGRQKQLLEGIEKAGPMPEEFFLELQELNRRTMEMVEKISLRKSQTANKLKAMGNKKRILSVYGGGA